MGWKQRFGARAIVVLTICGVVGTGIGTSSAGAATKPKSGGSVTFLLAVALTGLDPALQIALPSANNEAPAFLAIYDALLTPDAIKGVAKPRLASMSTKDSVVWTMTLKSGVKFSNGSVFDANAVKTNWDRIKNRAVSPARPNFDEVLSYVVMDPLTLTITLKNPNADFAYLLSTYAQNYIVAPQQLATNEAAVAGNPIGAGPYLVKEFVRSSSLTLVRNPQYRGKTYLDSITMTLVIDETQRLNTMRSGGADMMRTTDASAAALAKQQQNLKTTNVNVAGGQSIVFNVSKPPFNDVRARQAISYLLDANAVNTAVYSGAADVISTVFPKGSPYYDASITRPKTNDQKAQALFDELAAEGKPVDFTLTTTNTAQYINTGQWLQTKLAGFKKVTIKVTPLLSGSVTTTLLAPGNFQAVLFPPKFVVPADLVTYFQTGASKNYGRYTSPDMDAALRKATTASNASARIAATKDVQQILVKDLPVVFYVRDPNYMVLSKSIKGYDPGSYYFNVPDWTKIWKAGQ
jgi:peptide/nickel transport system substrate-binding protein